MIDKDLPARELADAAGRITALAASERDLCDKVLALNAEVAELTHAVGYWRKEAEINEREIERLTADAEALRRDVEEYMRIANTEASEVDTLRARVRHALNLASGALGMCSPCAADECQAEQAEWLQSARAAVDRELAAIDAARAEAGPAGMIPLEPEFARVLADNLPDLCASGSEAERLEALGRYAPEGVEKKQ